MIQRRVWVSGRVQGVGFRASTRRQALSLGGLKGYVKNLPDGRVEAVFQGEEPKVQVLVEWCRQGPPLAQVTDLQVQDESLDGALPAFGVAG